MGDAPTGRRSPFAADSEVAWVDAAPGIRRKVLCFDDGIMLVRFIFEAGAVGAAHSHPHAQCSVIESGVFDVTIDGKSKRLAAGDPIWSRRTSYMARLRWSPASLSTRSCPCARTSFDRAASKSCEPHLHLLTNF